MLDKREELLKRIAELEAQVYDLEKDLIHDPLTTLKTRAFFEEEIRVYLDAINSPNISKRKDWFGFKNISFLFFDIDHFKSINDTYGHDVGDIVLREVSKAIASPLRHGDTVSRWGGEEIIASLLGANEEDATKKAEEIRRLIEKLSFKDYPDLKVTISIGVASAEKGLTCEELVKRADEALYKAKETGRNKVVVYAS